jgi:hypothetical protein
MLTINGNSSIKRMFYGCRKLKSVTFYAITTPTSRQVTDNIWVNVPVANLTLYLPTISTWDGKDRKNNTVPGTISKTIDLSTIDFS